MAKEVEKHRQGQYWPLEQVGHGFAAVQHTIRVTLPPGKSYAAMSSL
jgi:hypothetical protein